MAERDFALLNEKEAKGLSSSYPGQQNDSAGFMFPYRLASGVMSGVQGVGFGGVNIDSNNNRITVGNIVLDGNTNTIYTEHTDSSKVGIGIIPDTTNEFGFFSTDSDGTLLIKIVGGTIYTYHPDTGVNIVQISKLTNGRYGAAFAKDGEDLVDALGS